MKVPDAVDGMKRDLQKLVDMLREDNAALQSRLAALQAERETVLEIARCAPELNMGNYDDDQVRELNNSMIEIYLLLNPPDSGCDIDDELGEMDFDTDCGIGNDGYCVLAGTEHCDFECPNRG